VKKLKDLVVSYFPEASPTIATATTTSAAASDGADTKWLESVLENLKMQLVSNKSSKSTTTTTTTTTNSSSSASPAANNLNNNNHLNNCSEVDTIKLTHNNNAVNGDSSKASSAAESELILLQNAQLKSTVEEYKNIIAETVSRARNAFSHLTVD